MENSAQPLRLCINCKFISGGSEAANCKRVGPQISPVTGAQRWRMEDACIYQRSSSGDCLPEAKFWEVRAE